METPLPTIPAKRYFTIGEVSDLCGVKPYVLRYWEQEFSQLKPMKRRGNRRYYQHHEVLLIRRIRELLYDQGFTISGARNRLLEMGHLGRADDPPLNPAASAAPASSASSPSEQVTLGLFGPQEMQVAAAAPVGAAAMGRSEVEQRPVASAQEAQEPPRPLPPLVIEPPVVALREELLAIRQLLLD